MAELRPSSPDARRVCTLIAETLGIRPDSVTPQSELDQLGADSLDLVEVLYVFEETFQVEIDVPDVKSLRTVADVIRLLAQHTSL